MENLIDEEISINISQVIDGDEILSKIMDWDFSRIKKYMVNKALCEPSMIDFIEIEYKRFMYLCVVSDERKVPTSKPVDQMWHTHLIFTKNYIAFCNAIRGSYIHHNPTTDENERDQLKGVYERNTLQLYRKHFGEPSEIFWNLGGQICAEECDDYPGT